MCSYIWDSLYYLGKGAGRLRNIECEMKRTVPQFKKSGMSDLQRYPLHIYLSNDDEHVSFVL